MIIRKGQDNAQKDLVFYEPMFEIESIDISNHPRKDDVEHLASLKVSIRDLGLLSPIVVDADGNLVDGMRRLVACKELGITHIPTIITTSDDPIAVFAALSSQVMRPKWSVILSLVDALLPRAKLAALNRKLRGKWYGPAGKFQEGSGEALDEVARIFNYSGRTLRKALEIWELTKTDPELYADIFDLMNNTGNVNGAYNRMKFFKQRNTLNSMQLPLPKGPFDVIVSDPPWLYPRQNDPKNLTLICPYSCDSIETITELDVPSLAKKDCVLFIWATDYSLQFAFEIVKRWGFTYKTTFSWIKEHPNPSRSGKMPMHQVEYVVMAFKGKPVVGFYGYANFMDTRRDNSGDQSTKQKTKRRKHSEKPQIFFDMVEQCCPGNKVELYGRRKRPGWVVWGLEASQPTRKRVVGLPKRVKPNSLTSGATETT